MRLDGHAHLAGVRIPRYDRVRHDPPLHRVASPVSPRLKSHESSGGRRRRCATDWAILEPLSDDERAELLSLARRRRFKKGEVVFHEGDTGDSLHLIVSGRVAMKRTTPEGDVATIGVIGAGQFFGEMALIPFDEERTATIVALEETETRSLHRDQFDQLRRQHPAVDRVLIDALAAKVRGLTDHLVEVLFVPADTRVFRRLLALADEYRGSDDPIVVPLTQDDLANMSGAARPTVNEVLKRAEAAGVLALHRGRIEILNMPDLARRARVDR